MGFNREAVETIEKDWAAVEQANEILERLRLRKASAVKREGAAARSKVVWKIMALQQVTLYRVVMLADGCAAAWNSRNVLVSILCARALIETCAFVLDFEAQLKRLSDQQDFRGIDGLVMNRTFGTRLKDWQGDMGGLDAVNVLNLIRKVDKQIPGVLSHYDVLSDICHPNSLGHNFMFGVLDKQTGTVRLSDGFDRAQVQFTHVFPAYLLMGLVENALDRIDRSLPNVLRLSEAERDKN